MKKTALFLCFFMLSISSFTQVNIASSLIKGGVEDAGKILKEYLKPLEKGLNYGNTMPQYKDYLAESKFVIGAGVSVAPVFINTNDYQYDIAKLNLKYFEASDPKQTNAQTIAGSNNTIGIQTKEKYNAPTTTFPYYTQKPIIQTQTPQGENLTILPAARAVGYIGFKGIYLSVNALPKLKDEDKKYEIFSEGLDVTVNINKLFFAEKENSFNYTIDYSYGYSEINYFLSVKPDENNYTFSGSNTVSYDNQKLQIQTNTSSYGAGVLYLKNKFTANLGYRYLIFDNETAVLGNYPIYSTDPSNNANIVVTNLKDPISYDRKLTSNAAIAQASYQFKYFYINSIFMFSEYYAAGIGLGIKF